jgi:hypothetical protein
MVDETYLIIDAVDECDDHSILVREMMHLLRRDGLKVKLVITSRPEHDLLRAFHDAPTIELLPDKTKDDISTVVEDAVNSEIQNGRLEVQDAELRNEIIRTLKEGAKGMYYIFFPLTDYRFLWVQLQLGAITSLSPQTGKNIRSALRHLPSDLQATYHMIINSVQQDRQGRDVVIRIFRALLGAVQPLRLDELVHCVILEQEQSSIETDDLPAKNELLLSKCRNLVRIELRHATVEFIHWSFKEFLMSFPGLAMGQSDIHAYLSKVCLTYLMLDCFKRPDEAYNEVSQNERQMPNLWGSVMVNEEDEPDRIFGFRNGISKCEIKDISTFLKAYPFFAYAALYWSRHFRLASRETSCEANQSRLRSDIHVFLQSSALETWIMTSVAFEARRVALGYGLEVMNKAFHCGYEGTDTSERNVYLEDLERFIRDENHQARFWNKGYFSQYLFAIASPGLSDDDLEREGKRSTQIESYI